MKIKSVTYSECVFVALGTQCAIHTHQTVFCGLSSLLHFSTLPHKWQDLKKEEVLNRKHVFWFSLQLFSETFLILRRIKWDMIINVYWSPCKVLILLSLSLHCAFRRVTWLVHQPMHAHKLFILTLSDPTSDLVRHYDFPLLLRCRVTSDTFLVAFVRPLRCRSLFNAFPHVVRTLANR